MGNSRARTQDLRGHRPESLARDMYVEFGWVCILAGSAAGLFFTSTSLTLWISITILAVLACLSAKKIQIGLVDWSVLLLCAFEIPSALFSQYRANSIRLSMGIVFFSLIYFVVRLTLRTLAQIASLSSLLGLGGACLALYGLSQFNKNVKVFGAVGLKSLIAFRSQLISPPGPWIPGEWFTLLLLALPLASALPVFLLQKQRKWLAAAAVVAPVLIAANLCLSLSRGVFWSVVVFCFLICVFRVGSRLASVRAAGILLGAALFALVLIVAGESALYPGLLWAYAGQQTSQVRSTQGRFEIWNRSLDLVRTHPVWGVGSGNAALSLTSTADHGETTGFAGRTFSLPVQVLVEKGIVGSLVYSAFLFLIAREFICTMRFSPSRSGSSGDSTVIHIPSKGVNASRLYKSGDDRAHRTMVCCFGAGLVAVLFRELTYSSLMEHSLTLALFAILAALVCRPVGAESEPCE